VNNRSSNQRYQMQDINNNISHRDMKPYLVDPSPLLETTFSVVSYDNNNVNTSPRAGNDTDLDVLGQYINEPGPNGFNSHPVLNNAMDSINLACNVHTRDTGIT
jgi:hypothetical protein